MFIEDVNRVFPVLLQQFLIPRVPTVEGPGGRKTPDNGGRPRPQDKGYLGDPYGSRGMLEIIGFVPFLGPNVSTKGSYSHITVTPLKRKVQDVVRKKKNLFLSVGILGYVYTETPSSLTPHRPLRTSVFWAHDYDRDGEGPTQVHRIGETRRQRSKYGISFRMGSRGYSWSVPPPQTFVNHA